MNKKGKDFKQIKGSAEKINMSEDAALGMVDKIRDTLPMNQKPTIRLAIEGLNLDMWEVLSIYAHDVGHYTVELKRKSEVGEFEK